MSMSPAPCGTRTAARIAGLAAIFILISCGQEAPKPPAVSSTGLYTVVDFEALPGWDEDRLGEAVPAIRRSCAKLTSFKPKRLLGPKGMAGESGEWQAACAAAAHIDPGDDDEARDYFETWYTPVRVAHEKGKKGLFTGYYEAELKGARWPGGRFTVPLYGLPADLIKMDLAGSGKSGRRLGRMDGNRFVAYYTRAEIEAGALNGRNEELLWVDDPVDAFFLHIQGSGRVVLPDGGVARVGYAGNNGHEFYGIGKALMDTGEVPRNKMSMQSIRDWLRANPERARELMNRNPRFIFFREIEGDGPIGATGVALTPGRSLAVDSSHLPYHAPMWLDTTWPGSDRPLRRLLVAQDTGQAIKGRVRGDLFWGYGEAALAVAGGMKQSGNLFVLLPKPVAARLVPSG